MAKAEDNSLSFMEAPEEERKPAPWEDPNFVYPSKAPAKKSPECAGSPEARSKTRTGKPIGHRGTPTEHPLKHSDGLWNRDKLCRYVFDVFKTTTITIAELFDDEGVYVDEDGAEWPLCDKRTFGQFLADEPDLYREFAAIKGLRGDLLADEALLVARNRAGDVIDNEGKDGRPLKTVNTANVARDRLLVDTLMRLAGIYNPRYTAKHQVEHSGEVGYKELREKVCGEGAEDLDSLKDQLGV